MIQIILFGLPVISFVSGRAELYFGSHIPLVPQLFPELLFGHLNTCLQSKGYFQANKIPSARRLLEYLQNVPFPRAFNSSLSPLWLCQLKSLISFLFQFVDMHLNMQ